MLLLKLSLVATTVLLASLVARRCGHTAAGMLAGLPMIAGPIMGLLLIDLSIEHARSVALATLAALPAMALHYVVFARASSRWPWPVCLLMANACFVAAGLLLLALPLTPWTAVAMAFAAPAVALRAMADVAGHREPVPVSRRELVVRVMVALALAASIIMSARWLPPAGSGLLLTLPVTANVLPCFALAAHGAPATRSLMAGFATGMFGFAAFFAALYLALPKYGAFDSFILACCLSGIAAGVVARLKA